MTTPQYAADLATLLTGRTIVSVEWAPNPDDADSGWIVLALDNGGRLYADAPGYYPWALAASDTPSPQVRG